MLSRLPLISSAFSSVVVAMGRVFAVGDVHGCVHALDALIQEIDPVAHDQLVFLGDLVDQGRDSRDVLDRIIELQGRCDIVLIQGNHEEMMLAARDNPQALGCWEVCGGATTLNSYRMGGRLDDVPQEHWNLLDQCRPFYETDDFILTHANYLPDAPMIEQPGQQLRWMLFDPEDMQPHESGKCVLLGHTEQMSGEAVDLGFAVCIDTACWRYGWLTAIELPGKRILQASKWGMLRDPGEATHRKELSQLLAKGAG